MACTYRRLADCDAIHAGIDLWNRVHPDFVIPDRLVAQNVFAPFASLVEHYRDAGYDRMIIDWTELVDYYGKLRFETWITYKTCTKEVSE